MRRPPTSPPSTGPSDLSTLAAAQYDLSKLYLRLAAVGQSSEARRKAQQADAAYLARHGSDDDFRANAWLVDALPSAEPPGRARRARRRSPGRRGGGAPAGGGPARPLGLAPAASPADRLALGARAAHAPPRPRGSVRPVRPARLPPLRPGVDGQLRAVRERLLPAERRGPARPRPQGRAGPAPRPGPALDRAGPGGRRRRRGARGGRPSGARLPRPLRARSSWGSSSGSGTA